MWYPPPVPAFSYMPAGFGIRATQYTTQMAQVPVAVQTENQQQIVGRGQDEKRTRAKGREQRNRKPPPPPPPPESEEEELEGIEALEFVEFDPTVDTLGVWEAPKTMTTFLEKYFNKALSDEERDAIRKDFPKPSGDFLHAPKLDEEVKDHLRRKGKDPHFGSEKALYKLHEQVLDVAGPLTCLWAGKGLRGGHHPAGAEGIGASQQCLTFYLTGVQEDCMDKNKPKAEGFGRGGVRQKRQLVWAGVS